MMLPVHIASWDDAWKKLEQETYDVLRQRFRGWPAEKPQYGLPTFWCEAEDMRYLKECGFRAEIDHDELHSQTGTAIRDLVDRYMDPMQSVTEGSPVQIVIPDLALLQYDEVDQVSDAYLTDVQSMLDDGWRILAVHPVIGDERPTYIFGRKKR